MGQITIRNLDDRAIEALKDRARENGRSLEAELRLLLEKSAQAARTVSEGQATYRAEPASRVAESLPKAQVFRRSKPTKFVRVAPVKVMGQPVSESLIRERR